MKNNRLRQWLFAALFLVASSGVAGDAASKPGLAVHYYQDDPYWGGNWTSDFLPKVAPEAWAFTKYLYTRVEDVVNHSFVNRSWFSMRMAGKVTISDSKTGGTVDPQDVTFHLILDHGARLWVDGAIVVDAWAPQLGGGREVKGSVSLTPGKHAIVLEAYVGPNTRLKDGLILKLLWQSDGYAITKGIIPPGALSHDPADLTPKAGNDTKRSSAPIDNP